MDNIKEEEIVEEVIETEGEENTTVEDEDETIEEIKAKAKKLAEEKEELEKKLKTALIQKEKKDEKLKQAKQTTPTEDVSEIKAELELVKFQITHKDLDESEIKLLQKFRQNGQSLEDVLKDDDVKDILETRRIKKEIDNGIPSFSTRSSSSGAKWLSTLEKELSGNLPPGYKLSNKK